MIYDASAGILIHFLKALDAVIRKAEAHIEAKKLDPEAFLKARLFPDMATFTRQIQFASDSAKGAGARLAGVPVPSFPDEEKTFDDLHARIGKTVDFLSALKKEQFEGAAERPVTLKIGQQEMTFTGAQYLATFALPNFYFHVTTAYDILRHNGVELGKRDYLGRT
ncbi:DUF1993 family protein [soil metagenome]